jgi:hypothetical protein
MIEVHLDRLKSYKGAARDERSKGRSSLVYLLYNLGADPTENTAPINPSIVVVSVT